MVRRRVCRVPIIAADSERKTMAKVSRRIRANRGPRPFVPAAEALATIWEKAGVIHAAITEHSDDSIPNAGVLSFDSEDAEAFAGFPDGVNNPVREVCRVLSAIDTKVWNPVAKTDDAEAVAVKVTVREAVRDENGEKVRNADGKVRRKARTVSFEGIGRSRTDSDENGNPVKDEESPVSSRSDN